MKPLILITNDDGVLSPGLRAAAEAVEDLGEIVIAAPHTQQTGMGRSFPRKEDNGKIDMEEIMVRGKVKQAYGVHGSPAYAVDHGILELCQRKPDLCISGINYGENLGATVTCSGTLGAAFEAASFGVPGIAVSLEADLGIQRSNDFQEENFTEAGAVLRRWAEKILNEGRTDGVDLWNINVPRSVAESGRYRITTQSRQNYFHFTKPVKRDLSRPYHLEVIRHVDFDTLEKDSDIHAVYKDHVISVTPLKMDMTAKIE